MIKNYIISAISNIRKNKLMSFITIIGFTIGISCASLIFLYVQYEFSFDKFHLKHNRIFRLIEKISMFDKSANYYSYMNFDIRKYLVSNLYINNVTQLIISDSYIGFSNRFFYEDNNILYTDSSFLKVFDFPLSDGDSSTALEKPGSIIITERMAKKYFGDENPVGKTLTLRNRYIADEGRNFKVTGVLKPIPQNSTLQFDFVINIPYDLLNYDIGRFYTLKDYKLLFVETYVELKDGKMYSNFLTELNITKKLFGQFKSTLLEEDEITCEPLDDIYLYSRVGKKGNMSFILLLIGLGIVIIVISCINIVNLTTAGALARIKEISVRKTFGAGKIQLIFQYLTESVVLSFISLIFSAIAVELFLPLFNILMQRPLEINYFNNPLYAAALILITFIIGIASGLYPAVYLSNLSIMNIYRQRIFPGKRFREALVIIQFILSICLFIISAIILREFRYIEEKDTGFKAGNIIMIRMNLPHFREKYQYIKDEFFKIDGVMDVSASSFAAWKYGSISKHPLRSVKGVSRLVDIMAADPGYLRINRIEIKEGKNFPAFSDSNYNILDFIINEQAQKTFGLTTNSIFSYGYFIGRIIGIAKDFNYTFPSKKINPLFITTQFPYIIDYSQTLVFILDYNYLLIRLGQGDRKLIIRDIEKKWNELYPGYLFEYRYVGKEMERQYGEYKKACDLIFNITTVLAFFLSCLGLFGLASYEAECRTKEIGIRKALGATSLEIVFYFLSGFLKLIAIANVIAWPLTILLIRLIFNIIQYPLSPQTDIMPFIKAGIVSIIAMILTVVFQIMKAASANPVNTLRYE